MTFKNYLDGELPPFFFRPPPCRFFIPSFPHLQPYPPFFVYPYFPVLGPYLLHPAYATCSWSRPGGAHLPNIFW